MLCLVMLSTGRSAAAQPQTGEPAPHFAITSDSGKHLTPTEFGGKLLILNFWQTDCVPCVKELPSLNKLARAMRSQGLVVAAISGDEDRAKYRNFLRDHHVTLETYRDPSLTISKSFGTSMFPETYIIQDGRILRKVVGAVDWMSDEMVSFARARLSHH